MNKLIMSLLVLSVTVVLPIRAMNAQGGQLGAVQMQGVQNEGTFHRIMFEKMIKKTTVWALLVAVSGVTYYSGISDFCAATVMVGGCAGIVGEVVLYCITGKA